MDLNEARSLATQLMSQHGLTGWRLTFDNAKLRAGICRPGRREIGLSRVLTGLHDEAAVRDTILHEIAHGLVGAEHGHDAVWRTRAQAIGCTGLRCVPANAPRPQTPWAGVCPAGHEIGRYRRPTRVMSCSQCSPRFNPHHVIDWAFNGFVVQMPPQYEAELARLRARAGAAPGNGEAVAASAAPGAAATSAAATSATEVRSAVAARRLTAGTLVEIGGRGRFAGVVGTIERVGRTRYRVHTRLGPITVPFALASALAPASASE